MLSCVIRFDNKETRYMRRCHDKLDPIRDLLANWVENESIVYNLSENINIGEQLLRFRGKCSFKQYTPSKPAQYGIKT